MVSTTAIAKYAGVSQTTVSRVLNKPDQVKKETYDKVMAAIKEWGYSSDPKEKIPQRKAANTIKIYAASNDPFILNGGIPALVNSAAEKGLFVNIHFDVTGEKEALWDELVSEGTAGVIISALQFEPALIDKLNLAGIPHVLLNTEYPDKGYSIGVNNSEAGYLAASHLIETGHQEIAWVGGPLTSQMNKDGLLGFVHALQANQHKIRKKRIVVTETEPASLYAAFESLLFLKKKPTAIVAATDDIAIRLMEFYQVDGWNVPEDISIIGLGNSYMASHPGIELTSVGTAATNEELGQEAMSLLLRAISDEHSVPRRLKKEAALIERKTALPLTYKKQSK